MTTHSRKLFFLCSPVFNWKVFYIGHNKKRCILHSILKLILVRKCIITWTIKFQKYLLAYGNILQLLCICLCITHRFIYAQNNKLKFNSSWNIDEIIFPDIIIPRIPCILIIVLIKKHLRVQPGTPQSLRIHLYSPVYDL